MTRNGTRQFGAFVEPNGIYLVEYKREREGVLILHQHSDPRRVARLADAGERLAAAIQTGGAVDSQLSVAMRGFGSVYQIMVLPAAKPSVLCPVVRREVARLNPEIENPRVNYVMHGEVERRKRARPGTGTLPRELLAAAAPETALSAFGEELSSAGVQLTHLTVLPQVVQRLYQQTDFSNAPTACYIGLESGPLLAFFHDGQLRLIAEPPFEPDEDLASRTRGIVEHLERGKLYLRQKFRGVELNRLLVAVDAPQEAPLLEAQPGDVNRSARIDGSNPRQRIGRRPQSFALRRVPRGEHRKADAAECIGGRGSSRFRINRLGCALGCQRVEMEQ